MNQFSENEMTDISLIMELKIHYILLLKKIIYQLSNFYYQKKALMSILYQRLRSITLTVIIKIIEKKKILLKINWLVKGTILTYKNKFDLMI